MAASSQQRRLALRSARVLLAAFVLARTLSAAEYFVSTTGSDANSGTNGAPFASLARGQQAAAPGDTVWIRGGVYAFTGTTADIGVLFDKSGTSTKPINYFAAPGETPVFDFFGLQTVARIRGFSVRADWLHFRGLELRGVQQIITTVNESWGIRIENGADNNVFERLNLHHNEGPGLFIADGGNNLVLNSDSHHNYDPDRGGGNSDGFGSHSNDNGNRFVGNRAWENSDDGYDCINSDGQVTFEGNWAWRNGYVPGTNTAAGNGAGFKSGGYGLDSPSFPAPAAVPTNVIKQNLAFSNRVQGFYANHHPGGLVFENNTSYGNSRGFDLINDVETATWPADHFLRNNVALGNGTNLSNANQALIDDESNTWNTGFAATTADFKSVSSAGVDGPRQADGSLPELDFMKLKHGSKLIDAGENVGLPFLGTAPDLGAYEFAPSADFDGNGSVDGADLMLWQQGVGLVGQTNKSRGDADGNGVVNGVDFEVWRSQFGVGAAPAARGVPEPSGAGMCAVGAALIRRRRRGRARQAASGGDGTVSAVD